MFEKITLIHQCPGIHEVWVLLKGTLLRWKPRKSLTPECLIFMGHSHTVGVVVCVWVLGGHKVFPVSVSVRYCVSNNARQQCFLEDTNFGFGSTLLFQRSTVIYCLRRKYSTFIEYAQCMSRYHDTCVHVHPWLARNDFNSSDHFRHRFSWIRVSFLTGIKVVVWLLSKNIGGNDVTSCVFLSLMLFEAMKVSTQ
jgi:hypothetical protein